MINPPIAATSLGSFLISHNLILAPFTLLSMPPQTMQTLSRKHKKVVSALQMGKNPSLCFKSCKCAPSLYFKKAEERDFCVLIRCDSSFPCTWFFHVLWKTSQLLFRHILIDAGHLIHRSLRHQTAAVQDNGPVAQPDHLLQGMGYE